MCERKKNTEIKILLNKKNTCESEEVLFVNLRLYFYNLMEDFIS